MEPEKTTNFGTITGIIIVIIVLIIGAFYFARQRMQKSEEFKNNVNQEVSTTSDELSDIENSANSMKFDDLGADIDSL